MEEWDDGTRASQTTDDRSGYRSSTTNDTMKEEAKRQQENETPLTTASGSTPFNKENTETGQPPATTSTQARGGSEETKASPTSSSTPDPTLSVPAVEFLLDDSEDFFIEAGRGHLLNIDGGPIVVPLNLHPGLGEGSGFQIDKHVCAIANPDATPTCEQVNASKGNNPTSQNSREADVAHDSLIFNSVPERAVGSAYYLRVKWSRSDVKARDAGFSYSTLFGVSDDNTFFNIWSAPVSFSEPESSSLKPVTLGIGPGQGYAEAPSELIRALNNEDGRSGDIASGGPSGTTAITSPSATNTVDSGEAPGATPSAASNGGGGGLSQGAIIGIGVAAGIVGLAAIGLLVWFFCLRNRRRGSKDHGPYAAPDHQASEYMVNKETTGAHVTESPHSPYSDDGSLAHAQGQGPSSLAQAQQTNQYSDAPPIATPVPRSASQQASDRPGSGAGTRSGPPGGHNVSHLIEEGMTEADIRRLEEEERALDDAIERAGHGRR